MAHTFHQNLAHIVFSTKDRRPLIRAEWETRLHAYLGGAIRDMKGNSIVINGMPDHIHILAKTPSTLADANLMRDLKCNATNWIKSEGLCADFAWQQGYGWFSIGASMIPSVREYIEHQKRHRENTTFKEEFIRFLNRYDVDYGERFLWE